MKKLSLKELNLYFNIMNVKLFLLNQEMLDLVVGQISEIRGFHLIRLNTNCELFLGDLAPPLARGAGGSLSIAQDVTK